MKILILEDEALAAERLIGLVKECAPETEVLAAIKSIKKGLQWLSEHAEPDLILSDIQLLDGLSFELFKQHPVNCPVIFTTAYDQYALQAFDVNSVDYLLKPVQKEKLCTALEKLGNRASKPLISAEHLETLAQMLDQRKPKYKSRFLVKLGNKIRSVATPDIAYFYTEEKLTFLVQTSGEKFPVDHSLEELESLLDPDAFFRINRKYTITHEAVSEIHPYFKGRLKIELNHSADDDIVVSADKTPLLKSWLDR